jgi:glycosyltransferase involved in cell wall biosynthesis
VIEKATLRMEEEEVSSRNEFPLVSILIPMRNEEKYIEACIKSLIGQKYPQDSYEVIVVDGMSEDGSKEIVQSLLGNHSNIFLLENRDMLTSFGLNIGIEKSRGAIVSILGAHSFVEAEFIKENVEAFKKVEADCVGGPIRTLGKTYGAKVISLAMSSPFGVGNALFRYSEEEGYVDTLAFGAYKKDVFRRIGAFDEELVRNQDDEFNYRLRKAGGRIFMTPRIRSFYHSRATLKKVAVQYFQYGLWKVRLVQKHLKMMMLRQFVPAVFVLSVVMSLLLSFYDRAFLGLFLLISGSYFACNLFFSFKIAKKYGWKYFLFLPIVFITIHWSYGLGFLIGLFRFFHRWFIREQL